MMKQGDKKNRTYNTYRTYLIVVFALAVFVFAAGYRAVAEQYDPKEYPQSYIDVYPKDFADPNKYDPKNERRTPEGIQYASPTPRSGTLQKTYTELGFDMGKVYGDIKPATGSDKCLTCHEGIEEISAGHNKISCAECHGGNAGATDIKAAHSGMVSNPSDLSVAEKNCAKCHKDHVSHVSGSLMATAAGEINSTRYLWGVQDSPKAVYGTKAVNGLKVLPKYNESKELVDDFLRKKCVRCHLNSPAPKRQGEYRATGCAACHMLYSNDGKTKTGDKAIKEAAAKGDEKLDLSGLGPAKRGYPLVHKFTAAVPTIQCARCHSGNRTGTQYLGMTEHDYEQMYRSPRDMGRTPAVVYGIEQHFLKRDIHAEKGMHCIDCHNQSEVEGDGKSYSLAGQAVKVRCQDCHGTPTSKPKTGTADAAAVKIAKSNPNYSVAAGDKVAVTSGGTLLANVKEEGGKLVLTSKVTGKKHTVPILADMTSQPANHQVAAHIDKMECHACHARWVSQDWGLHLMREDYIGYDKWKRWREPDPNTEFVLFSNLEYVGDEVGKKQSPQIWGMKPEKPAAPETMDWLTGEKSTGVWYMAYSVRNWEDVVLGYNSRGKASIFAPQYQYFVSHIGSDFMNAKNEVKTLENKITNAATEEERTALKSQLVEAKKKADAQILKDSEIPKTKDGKIGWAMNPVAPHTTGEAVRSCEKCHQNGNAAGLGQTVFYKAQNKNAPLMDNARMGLPIDFQLSQMVAENGDVLQTTTHQGARPFNSSEIKALMGKSPEYRAFRYLDLAGRNYLTIQDRKGLTGGLKREVMPEVSLGDVREVGSYYDWKRYGFWQTDPAVFKDEYFMSADPKKMKTDLSKDPNIAQEKKGIETQSLTFGEEINPDWRPRK
ncbi:MAG: hypothetical protein HY808_06535 [Nitrospirae bacterium]|nr:hypothetical protein [Nitrospirota bacterium]